MDQESRPGSAKVIDGSLLVANSWWEFTTERGPQTYRNVHYLGGKAVQSVQSTVSGQDHKGNKVISFIRQGDDYSCVRIGDLGTQKAVFAHFDVPVEGTGATGAILAAGVDTDRLNQIEGLVSSTEEENLAGLAADLQSQSN